MRLILILLLNTLVSCGSLVGTQVFGLVYNLPEQAKELEQNHKDNLTCLRAKQCVSYWNQEAGIYIVHKYTVEELEDIQRTESKESAACLAAGKCTTYFNIYYGKTLVHSEDEQRGNNDK